MPHTRTRTRGPCEFQDGLYEGGLNPDMQPHGHGVWTQLDAPSRPGRDSYAGQWRDGDMNGAGTYTYDSGMSYTGEWRDGDIHTGVVRYTDDTTYSGAFRDMLRHGSGTFTWACGDTYEGTFTAGDITGHGALYHVDGYRYTGSIQWGVPHGHGMETYLGGTTYTGAFEKNKRNGLGTMTWPSGSTYTGAFLRDDIHGDGVFHERTEPAGDVLWSFNGSLEHDRPTAGVVRDFVGMTEYQHTFAPDCEYIYNCSAPPMRRVPGVCG
mgnify:CR=1 FL=1